MAFSKDDIFKAADTLDAAGQSPTLAAVRKALGGGSFTTISEPLNEWKAKRRPRKWFIENLHRLALVINCTKWDWKSGPRLCC
jgi:hypothetical protein